MPYPDFIIGGAPKAGTTALFRYLSQHPGVFTSTPKEPHYFLSAPRGERVRGMNYSLDDYLRLFEAKRPDQRAGEGSTGYLHGAAVAAPAIAAAAPDVRLVFLLRNPITRAYSDYWFRTLGGDLPLDLPFSAYVEDEGHWLFHGSNYYGPLRTYRDHFDREQVLVLLSEDLRTDPGGTLRAVCAHIGVDPDFPFDSDARHNVTRYPRSVSALRWVGRVAPSLSPWAVASRWARPLRSRLLFSSRSPMPPMDPADQRRLADRFAPDVEKLSDLLGRDLSAWVPDHRST